MDERIVYIINAIAYLALTYLIYRSNYPGRKLAFLLCCLFSLSAVTSILYYDSSLYFLLNEHTSKGASIFALIYLYICFVIYIYPVTQVDLSGSIDIPLYPIFIKVAILIGIISILPFIENVNRLINMSFIDMASAYDDSRVGDWDTRSHFSTIGHIMNGIVSWFSNITPILAFYMLVNNQRKIFVLLAFVAYLNPIIPSFFFGGRGALYMFICGLLLFFIVFYNYFSQNTINTLKKIGVVSLALLSILFLGMTFARSETNDIALQQIYRYFGESFVNFSEAGCYVTKHTLGYSIFNGTGHTFMADISDYFKARDYESLTAFTGVRMYVYYTVFGDYFIDFGWLGGILFTSLLSLLFLKYAKEGVSRISSVVLLYMYMNIGFRGVFHFVYMYELEFVCFALICVFLIRRYEKNSINLN